MAALAANVHRHVFNNPQDRHPNLFKHLDALLGIQQRNVLRRRDDHRARHGYTLAQGELDVARTGGHVHNQVIQIAPIRLAQQLLQRLRCHRAAPDHGFVLSHQKANGHDLHTIVFQRLHGLAVVALGATIDAHHHRNAGAVDVGIQQAHAGPLGGQSQGQIDGRSALAHAALA